MAKGLIVIANINIEIPCKGAKTEDEARAIAEDYDLPDEYVCGSFEIVKVMEE